MPCFPRLFLAFLLLVQTAHADVRLPQIFGSHQVLQRRKPVPVWGWAEAGEKVTVTLSTQTKTAKADGQGRWRVTLDPMEAGGPYTLTARGKKNAVTLDDVLVGEVWICSGQSNMEWKLANVTNAPAEIRAANHPQIRQFLVKKTISLTPKDDAEGTWTVCTPETAPNFTAVGYFFARELNGELNVPIGLVHTSWGGTHSETWTSREAMQSDPELRTALAKLPTDLESVRRSGQERIAQLLQEQQNGQLPTLAEERAWANPAVDDRTWRQMKVPGDWEWRGLPGVDGVVWFRREVTIPSTADLRGAVLRLGIVEDFDSTYVNGQLIGSTRDRRPARSYDLPEGVLRPGRNVIAIRVEDRSGVGGIQGEGDQLKLTGDQLDVPLTGEWSYRVARTFPSSYEPGPNTYGTLLFNAMLNPLIPYAMQGVIWYQGESNAGRAHQYRRTFPLLIQDWRQHWAKATGKPEDFPFLFVQLASYNASGGDSQRGSAWAELREAQTMTLALPNTGMAVTSDIGESSDIHPRNKQDVGKRLAAEALRIAYGQNRVSAGPIFEKMEMQDNHVILSFKNVGSGLLSKDKYGYLRGFEVAGSNQKFHFAKAEIRGNQVVVRCDSVPNPVAVRYGWADDNGEVNLYNREGFPACPFRTDTWKGITEERKF
jgi:sialate O-acetylesterase